MSNSARSGDSVAKAVAGVLLVVVVLNVVPRVVGMPDLPSFSLPDLPAWADTGVDALHTVRRVKNWLVAGVVALVVVGVAVDGYVKRRAR
jgi:hypothetical protein